MARVGTAPEATLVDLVTRLPRSMIRVGMVWLLWWWPHHHAQEVQLTVADGTRAWIRPVRPGDRDLLRRAYEQLSDEAKYQRFLASVPHLTESMLDHLVDEVDGIDHVAFSLTVQGQESELPVAVGRIVRCADQPDTADIGLAVQDDWQGRGIGLALASALVERRPSGVRRIVTVVGAGNVPALRMLRRIGSDMRVERLGGGYVEVHLELADPLQDG